ncbi:MAG TPA: DUF2950 domain-containing protein [Candidatus Acidoferrales bacterium]|nr:DUF2950 domain-containing protein [Candidatus Acidoferrales bacterium]
MQRSTLSFERLLCSGLFKFAAIAVLLAAGFPARSMAQRPGQKTFSSCDDATKALVTAAQNNDENALMEILGPDGKDLVKSGDDVEDASGRATFVERYEQMHRLVKEPDGTTTLYVGAENWPMPIPLVNKGKVWYFDTAAGKKEILYRRVGRNEISTIRVCQELVAAQKEYYSAHSNEYAQKILSNEGQQDGLYWKADNGQSQSPIGPLVAQAVAEGYTPTHDGAPPTPYRGYFYHMLTRQGASAPGGAKSYVVDGKMTGGFAFVAYPAEYRSSGVMTFIVGSDGVVYRKDLGPNTATIAKALKSYNPDATWKKDQDQQEESAAMQKSN